MPDFGNYRYLYFDLNSIFTFSSTVFAMFLCSANILFLFHSPTFYCPPTKLPEGNVFSRVCLSVILFKEGGLSLYRALPSLDLKHVQTCTLYLTVQGLPHPGHVQLGPHHTVPFPPPTPHVQTCLL